MPRPTIEFLNARKAALAAGSGGDYTHLRAANYAPNYQLQLHELTELQCESAWADYRIRAAIMWEQIFTRVGLQQGYDLAETF